MNLCYYCNGGLGEQLTTFIYEDGDQFWIVRNVPAFVCTRCGEKEYTQETTPRVLALPKVVRMDWLTAEDTDDLAVRRELAAASVSALGDFWDNEVDVEWQSFQP